jgi:hypothetical protein
MTPKYSPTPKSTYKRKTKHTAAPTELMMGELKTHYDRLCRVGNVDFWKVLFAGGWQALAGAFIGAAIASASAIVLLPLGVGTGFSFIAWVAVRDTEAETVSAIRSDYKRDILDSFDLVPEDQESAP